MSSETNTPASSIISRGLVTDNGLAQTIPCGSGRSNPEPSIQLIKDGDVIRAIHVRCSCGEVIKVVCNYE